jgi:hypothetical protein
VKTVNVGIRVDVKNGIGFFGLEEVNQSLQRGARVVEVRPGGAIMTKLGEEAGNVQLTLTGCNLQVVLDEPS